jgi:hypothetical protein
MSGHRRVVRPTPQTDLEHDDGHDRHEHSDADRDEQVSR